MNASSQPNYFLSWTSFEEWLPSEDHNTLLISLVYHCQSFLISHEQSLKEDSLVILFFSEPGALNANSFSYYRLHIIHAIPEVKLVQLKKIMNQPLLPHGLLQQRHKIGTLFEYFEMVHESLR